MYVRKSAFNAQLLARRATPQKGPLLMQLRAYFDESGEHNPVTGHLVHLHVGGVLASTEDWRIIDEQWRDALRREDIAVFHMKDFSSKRGEFKGWTKDRCHVFMNHLLDILAARDLSLIAVSFPDQNASFKDVYARCMAQVVNGVCSIAFLNHHSFDVSVVFAKSPASQFHTNAFWEKVRKEVPDIGSCSISTPQCLSQLQVADLVCYEFSHMDKPGKQLRYPLLRLLRDQKSFHVRRIPPRHYP
jgi:hypothetical protein